MHTFLTLEAAPVGFPQSHVDRSKCQLCICCSYTNANSHGSRTHTFHTLEAAPVGFPQCHVERSERQLRVCCCIKHCQAALLVEAKLLVQSFA
jgi:hypothetical protein